MLLLLFCQGPWPESMQQQLRYAWTLPDLDSTQRPTWLRCPPSDEWMGGFRSRDSAIFACWRFLTPSIAQIDVTLFEADPVAVLVGGVNDCMEQLLDFFLQLHAKWHGEMTGDCNRRLRTAREATNVIVFFHAQICTSRSSTNLLWWCLSLLLYVVFLLCVNILFFYYYSMVLRSTHEKLVPQGS
jgi:hypothetical protein